MPRSHFHLPICLVLILAPSTCLRGAVQTQDELLVSLGVLWDDVDLATSLRWHIQPGLPQVALVLPDGAAARAGLQPGDILLRFAGRDVRVQDKEEQYLEGHGVGDEVEVVVLREGAEQTVSLVLQERRAPALLVHLLRKRANHNDAVACRELGRCYYLGFGVKEDRETGIRWLRKAGELGDMRAQNLLGMSCLLLKGFCEDKSETQRWLRRAAEQGQIESQVALGMLYLKGGGGVPRDGTEAVKWMRMPAERGCVVAQMYLAVILHRGMGVPVDKSQAMHWIRLAAEQGMPEAQATLGMLLAMGEAGRKDVGEAMRLFRIAADKGVAAAEKMLGDLYYGGEGVAQDRAEAVRWYRFAADQGYTPAQLQLGMCYFLGQGVVQDDARAFQLLQTVAEHDPEDDETVKYQGAENLPFAGGMGQLTFDSFHTQNLAAVQAEAQHNLAACYSQGRGVPQDQAKAIGWLRRAAQGGHPPAQRLLGLFLLKGVGLRADTREAVRWLGKAADNDDMFAEFLLGNLYAVGINQPDNDALPAYRLRQDYTEALRRFREAASQGMGPAQYAVGFLLFLGLGEPRDIAEAVVWLRQAADQGLAPAQATLQWIYTDGRDGTMPEGTLAMVVQATEQGNNEPAVQLGLLYERGRNREEAIRWFRAAAEHGHVAAMTKLGWLLVNSGPAYQDNYQEAAEWFRKAAEHGEAQAMYNLGQLHLAGKGVARNRHLALEWFRQAAALGDEDARDEQRKLEAEGAVNPVPVPQRWWSGPF
jgi:TPR repeat protein